MCCGVTAALVGVYVAAQLALFPLGAPSVQLAAGVKPPAPSVLSVTVPLGPDAVPFDSVSVTVAVHVVPCPTVTGEVQLTAVVVARLFTIWVSIPVLPTKSSSPLYTA